MATDLKTRNLRLSFVVSAPPSVVYTTWLDSAGHTAMTGGLRAEIEPRTFGRHMAGDGHIDGVTLELDAGRRIVQTWRAVDFPKNAPDSRLELHFEPTVTGTKVVIEHDDVPEELAEAIEKGWMTHYATRMSAYFRKLPASSSSVADKVRKAAKTARATATKAVATARKTAKRTASKAQKTAQRTVKKATRAARNATKAAKARAQKVTTQARGVATTARKKAAQKARKVSYDTRKKVTRTAKAAKKILSRKPKR